MNRAAENQLRQIAAKSPHPGVHAGDLIDKTSTRWLVEGGYANNSGGSPSSLAYVTITDAGRAMLDMLDDAKST
jgi:transcription initiation factor TFIID subunit TAF12